MRSAVRFNPARRIDAGAARKVVGFGSAFLGGQANVPVTSGFDATPRMLAQRKRLQATFGGAIRSAGSVTQLVEGEEYRKLIQMVMAHAEEIGLSSDTPGSKRIIRSCLDITRELRPLDVAWKTARSFLAMSRPAGKKPTGTTNLAGAKLGDEIKSGAYGTINEVLKADSSLAVKFARGHKSDPNDELKTFEQLRHEAKIYARVGEHKNIAKSFGMQTIEGRTGLVMERIQGSDMGEVIKVLRALRDPKVASALEFHALSESDVIGVVRYVIGETLEGLQQISEGEVVHADLRPANVMASKEGDVKIIDFGQAFGAEKVNKQRSLPVHLGMVAPEQATPDVTVTGKADIFAAGAFAHNAIEETAFNYGNPGSFDPNVDIAKFGKIEGDRYKQALPPARARTNYGDFVNTLMHPDPTQRPDPSDALKHAFLGEKRAGNPKDLLKSVVALLNGRSAASLLASINQSRMQTEPNGQEVNVQYGALMYGPPKLDM